LLSAMKEFGLQSAILALRAAERAGGGKCVASPGAAAQHRNRCRFRDCGYTGELAVQFLDDAVHTRRGSIRSGSVFAAGVKPSDTRLVWS